MYMSREVFHCKPGRAKDLVNIFRKLAPVLKGDGVEEVRIYTDVSAENYWTVIVEEDIRSIDDLADLSRKTMSDPKVAGLFAGYHDLLLEGRRELYRLE